MTAVLWVQLIAVILVPVLTAVLGWWFGRRRDAVQLKVLVASELKTFAEQEKLSAEAENLKADTSNVLAGYWQRMAEDVEIKAKQREIENIKKITELEAKFAQFEEVNKHIMVENRELRVRVSRLQAAFEYLCVQFEKDYSAVVSQARTIAGIEEVKQG